MSLAFLAPARSRRFADPRETDDLADAVSGEETALRRAFLAAVREMLVVLESADTSNGVSSTVLSDMLRAFDTTLTERGQPSLEQAHTRGAQFAYDRLPRSVTVGYSFDLINPEAVLWSQIHSATMVTSVSDETRRAIRSAITRALSLGADPRDVARQIHDLIGLTERDALAVGNLRTRLIEEGRSDAQIERMVARYAARLLRRRAETIAIHETMTAANRGQEALWSNAVGDGLLVASEWERKWIIARDERTCKLCRPLDGKRAPMLGGSFEGGVVYPPRHVRCRCTTGLVRKR